MWVLTQTSSSASTWKFSIPLSNSNTPSYLHSQSSCLSGDPGGADASANRDETVVTMMVMLVVQMVMTATRMRSKKLSLFHGLSQSVFTATLWGKIYTFSAGEVQRWSAEMLCVRCIYGHTVVRDPKFEPWKRYIRIAIKPYWEFGFIYPDQAQQGVGMSVPKCEICTQLTAFGWI